MNKPSMNLAGLQQIVTGIVEATDSLTFQDGAIRRMAIAGPELSGCTVELAKSMGLTVYRKMPVPRQGGLDHEHPVLIAGTVSTDPFERGKASDPSKARTDDGDKAPLANLPPAGLRAVAGVQAYGHKKYGDFNNYRKGMEHSRQISCAMRHLMAHMDGETLDPESGQAHLAHAACRVMFLIQNIADGVDIDDRFKRPVKSS